MFAINHAATALLIKKAYPDAPMAYLLGSVQLVELLWVGLNFAGVEKTKTEARVRSVKDVHLADMPFSHSIVSTLVLAAGAWLVIAVGLHQGRLAAAVALGIASHIVLDLLSHARDIVIAPFGKGIKLGLGLYEKPAVAFGFETGYGVLCWAIYGGSTALLAAIVVFNLANVSFFLEAVPGPERFLAGKPKAIASVVAFQIVVTAFLVGALARKESGDMHHVISKDSTRIAYERRGQGPPLVLVHGTGIDHTYWDPVAPELERRFTVYNVDRRGRGRSGDTPPYAIEREFEDVVAMIENIPDKVYLLGHSYGALCSLEAALLTTHIRKMILNEPPMYTTVNVVYPADAPERVLAYFKAGEAEKALLALYEAGGTSTAELNLLRSLPNWQARILAAPTIPREFQSVRDYSFDPSRFKRMETPTLLLLGGDSAPVYKAAIETLHSSLPNSRLVILPGQPHDAAVSAPEPYLREVIRFFLENACLEQ